MRKLLWKTRQKPGQYFRLIKVACERGSLLELHTHDFPEFFWIEMGECLHRVNDTEQKLPQGSLVFIRPKDAHQLCAIGRRRFTMINMEIAPAVHADLIRRFPREYGVKFPCNTQLPVSETLSKDQNSSLGHLLLDHAASQPTRLNLEHILLGILRVLEKSSPGDFPPGTPDWLRNACLLSREPEILRNGVQGLAKTCGKCQEYVSRSFRHHLDMSPSDWITRCRMDHAERSLRMTDDGILEIALRCGYQSLAQFYKVFRARYEMTPRQYRISGWK